MSFRAAAQSAGTSSAISVPNPGVQHNDRVLILIVQDGFANVISSLPKGFTEIANASISTPDGQCIRLYELKRASINEPANYAFTSSAAASYQCVIGVWSGRNWTAAATFVTITSVSIVQPSAIALIGTTGTVIANDDLAVFVGLDFTTVSDRWSIGSWGQSLIEQADITGNWGTAALATRDAVAAGAFGSVTATATQTVGTTGAGSSIIAVSLPIAAAESNQYSAANTSVKAAWRVN